ncbi:MAG: hypothetical protein GY702_26655 [Desulfobulbaceae bacterium]|nr:hypothetical protein [Desulfobulbaceae bacterium]
MSETDLLKTRLDALEAENKQLHDKVKQIETANQEAVSQTLRTSSPAAERQPTQSQAHTHIVGLKPPGHLTLTPDSQKIENWKTWKQQWANYSLLSGLSKLNLDIQCAMLENCLGPEALKTYNSLSYSDEETKSIATIMNKLEQLFIGELNETYERYIFNSRKQLTSENIETYVTELKMLATNCNFCACMYDSLLRDRVVIGILCSDTRKRLLQTKNLTLQSALDICRADEATANRMKNIDRPSHEDVHQMRAKGKRHQSSKSTHKYEKHVSSIRDCKFCGKRHEMSKEKCPAYGQICSKCKGQNHLATKCTNKKG